MSEVIFSVDVETSGPVPGEFRLFSIGAVAYDLMGNEIGSFSKNIMNGWDGGRLYQPATVIDGTVVHEEHNPRPWYSYPGTAKWWESQPEAWAAHQKDQERLLGVVLDFDSFIKDMLSKVDGAARPVFLADPVVFDYPFLDWMFRQAGIPNPFHFQSPGGLKVVDLDSFAMGALGMKVSERHATYEDLGLYKELPPHTHIAVDDAREQGVLFFRLAKLAKWPRLTP